MLQRRAILDFRFINMSLGDEYLIVSLNIFCGGEAWLQKETSYGRPIDSILQCGKWAKKRNLTAWWEVETLPGCLSFSLFLVLNSSVSIHPSLWCSLSPSALNKYPLYKLNLTNFPSFCFSLSPLHLLSSYLSFLPGFLKYRSSLEASPCHYSSPGFKMSLTSLL